MAQSERALVHPLEIVDRQERRLERPGSPMSGLEDPHRLERRRPRRRIEEDCLQPFAVARALRERSEESRRRRERDLAFGLVADDAEPIRNVDTPRGLREEPALADTGIPDDERRHRPADRGARDGLDKRLELGGPAHERSGHGSSVEQSEPLLYAHAQRRAAVAERLDLDPEVLHSDHITGSNPVGRARLGLASPASRRQPRSPWSGPGRASLIRSLDLVDRSLGRGRRGGSTRATRGHRGSRGPCSCRSCRATGAARRRSGAGCRPGCRGSASTRLFEMPSWSATDGRRADVFGS